MSEPELTGVAEIKFLKRLGVKPVRIAEDGTETEIEFGDLSAEELQKVYGVEISELHHLPPD